MYLYLLFSGPDGSMRALDAVCVDPTTGLLTPDPECVMLLANHCLVPVSRDLFLHPETGKVLPVAGNIGYDPISSKLVCAVDSTSGKTTSGYIIHPLTYMWGIVMIPGDFGEASCNSIFFFSCSKNLTCRLIQVYLCACMAPAGDFAHQKTDLAVVRVN